MFYGQQKTTDKPTTSFAAVMLFAVMVVALIVAAIAWSVTHVDDLLSFNAFKLLFVSQTMLWTVILSRVAYDAFKKRQLVAEPVPVVSE